MKTVSCKFAFSSPEEEYEWKALENLLKNSKDFPVKMALSHTENVKRLERHGYSVRLSYVPNIYEITKKDK